MINRFFAAKKVMLIEKADFALARAFNVHQVIFNLVIIAIADSLQLHPETGVLGGLTLDRVRKVSLN